MKHHHTSMKILTYSLITLLLALLSAGCDKDEPLSEYDSADALLPSVIEPYDEAALSEVENLRNDISILMGRAISNDETFRSKVLDRLIDERQRKVLSYPVLQLLEDNFDGLQGATILSQISNRVLDAEVSPSELKDRVLQIEPTMVLQIPTYVEAYFNYETILSEGISTIKDYPFAFFPETSVTNHQNLLYSARSSYVKSGEAPILEVLSHPTHVLPRDQRS